MAVTARAIIINLTQDTHSDANGNIEFNLIAGIYGSDGTFANAVGVDVPTLSTDTASAIQHKIALAVQTIGATLGFTVALTDVFIPQYTRGN